MAKSPHKSPTFRIRYAKSSTEDGPGSTSPNGGDGPPASAAPRSLRIRILDATIEASLGKVWWYRSPLLIPVAWIFCRHVTDSEYGSIFAGINLATHEGEHLFFMWF